MKILSIRIKNLASLAGEHFIDFESEPLANAGLIAIVGKTGAGKSIAIDALGLCLGERAEISMIRPGAERTELTARFNLGNNPCLFNIRT